MCGRYNIITDADALVDAFDIARVLLEPGGVTPRYNVAPSQDVPVVRASPNGRELTSMRWGLVPSWSRQPRTSYSTINARVETVADKPAYRNAFRQRRCLIPATGFYEWQKLGEHKIPHHICMQDGSLFAFAGIWEHWQQDDASLDSCSILVTRANRLISGIHDRMPVILGPETWSAWLDPQQTDRQQLLAMLQPFAAEPMRAYPVSRLVNNPRNDQPECTAPA